MSIPSTLRETLIDDPLDNPTATNDDWPAVFRCSGVSASQFCRAKRTAVLEDRKLRVA